MFSVLEAHNLLGLTSLISIFFLFSLFTTCPYYWVLLNKEMNHELLSYCSFLPSVERLWLPGAVPVALDWVEVSLCQMIHLGVLSRPLGAFASCRVYY